MSGGTVPLPRRLQRALLPALRFAVLCAVLLLVAIGLSLHLRGFAPFPRTGIALLVLALPPALVGGLAALAIDTALPRAGRLARGLLMLAALAVLGLAASVTAFGLIYRNAYPGEFAPLLSKSGLHEAVWTAISATYLFLIAGPRLTLPLGPVAILLLAAAFAARRPRH